MTIEKQEYRSRQQTFAASLDHSGLGGAVVVSRGGSTLDRYANVLYLTGHYQSYSYLPDAPGLFSGRAHTALVMSASGRAILCTSVPEYDEGSVFADDVRCTDDFAATIAGATASLGLDRGPLGLIGADVLPFTVSRKLASLMPSITWRDCEDLLLTQRRSKSAAERDIIRRAAAIHTACLESMKSLAIPGHTEADLIAEFGRLALKNGAGLYFTSLASGPKIARWASCALPGFGVRRLAEGDLVRFDMGIVVEGYLSDFGRTLVIGEPTAEQRRLLDTLHLGIDAVLAAVKPGRSVRDVVTDGEKALRDAGVTANDQGRGTIHASFPVHWGHGLGLGWERPWITETETLSIEPWMYLAIERALTATGIGTAAAEQTVLVAESGIEILSECANGRWS
jgi:Xaa-Pro dipeptidase